MFENETQKSETPLVIVCDDKDMVYANYLIQLIGQKKDTSDCSVSAAVYTPKTYKDNLPQIPSTQHILFIGHFDVAKDQSKTISDKFNEYGMHYGWLGRRAVLYIDDTFGDLLKLKDKKQYTAFLQLSEKHGIVHKDALPESFKKVGKMALLAPFVKFGVGIAAGKMLFDHVKASSEIKEQQNKTLIKIFYDDGLKAFLEG